MKTFLDTLLVNRSKFSSFEGTERAFDEMILREYKSLNFRNERELDSVRAGRDRSAGTAHRSCGHEGSIPSVPTTSTTNK